MERRAQASIEDFFRGDPSRLHQRHVRQTQALHPLHGQHRGRAQKVDDARRVHQTRESDPGVAIRGIHLSKPLATLRLLAIIHFLEYSPHELVHDAHNIALKVPPLADDAHKAPQNHRVQRHELGQSRTLKLNRHLVPPRKRRAVHLRERRRRHGRWLKLLEEINRNPELALERLQTRRQIRRRQRVLQFRQLLHVLHRKHVRARAGKLGKGGAERDDVSGARREGVSERDGE